MAKQIVWCDIPVLDPERGHPWIRRCHLQNCGGGLESIRLSELLGRARRISPSVFATPCRQMPR